MNVPNPSRAALFGAALLLFAALCVSGAGAQSGRKGQKPLGLPTEKPTPADPADKAAAPKNVEPTITLLVLKDDTLSVSYDSLARDDVAATFVERLRRVGRDVEIKDGGKGRRQQARDLAKKEEKAYVVFFQMEETGYGSTAETDLHGVALRTYVYTPKTGDLKFSDTIFQRPYRDSARVGGVRVPVPTRRVERYPSQLQLQQSARDAADRVLARFQITPPPEQWQ